MKRVLALGAVALALGGCAAGPYYDTYGYDAYGNPVYAGPTYDYGAPYYSGPSVSFGYYDFDSNGQRHWHEGNRDGNRNGQWNGNDGRHWRGNDGNWNRDDRSPPSVDNSGRMYRDREGNAYSVPDPAMSGPNPPNSGRVVIQNNDGSQTPVPPADATRR